MHTVNIRPEVLDEIKSQNFIRSDRELALRVGLSPAIVNQVRSGVRNVGVSFITAMNLELGVPFDPSSGGLYVVTR